MIPCCTVNCPPENLQKGMYSKTAERRNPCRILTDGGKDRGKGIRHCCGVDVHKKLIMACLRSGRKNEIRQFGATMRELLEMAAWLDEVKCEMVAMESTALYWKPLYNVLETWELPVMVVNAHHMKAVPGRKTDVQDTEWKADLLQHGLLKASNIHNKEQRELRELVQYRKSLIEDRGRELNRLQKMLECGKNESPRRKQ